MNFAGVLWAACIDTFGEPTADLRSNIAAEARAKIVYELLIKLTVGAVTQRRQSRTDRDSATGAELRMGRLDAAQPGWARRETAEAAIASATTTPAAAAWERPDVVGSTRDSETT